MKKSVPFVGPSRWEPNPDLASPDLRDLVDANLRSLRRWRPHTSTTPNITQSQQQIIKQLSTNTHIVIKPADKGGQLVLQDINNYILEANRQLNNPNYYKKLEKSLQSETQTIIRQIISDLHTNKYITYKQKTYLDGPDKPRLRLFLFAP